jgi:hypothetical protein
MEIILNYCPTRIEAITRNVKASIKIRRPPHGTLQVRAMVRMADSQSSSSEDLYKC